MGLWSFLMGGPELSNTSPQVRSAEPGPSDPSTVNNIPTRGDFSYSVPSGEALGMIAVYRAAQIISTSVQQLSFDAFRNDEELAPKPLLLRKPDMDESLSAFLEKTSLSLVLNGNAFWRVFRDNQGRVTGLQVLNPLDVTIETDSFGRVTGYKVANYTQVFTKAEVKHLSHLRVPGDPRGRGPIQAAQAELRGALDTQKYAANWYQDAGVPTGILSSDQPFNNEAAENLKEQWKASQGGTRGTAVLGGGWHYTPVYLSPADAQWLEVRQFDTTSIARLFGIPAGLMLAAVEGSSMTYANISQAWTEFQRFTLVRYVVEIEDAFSDLLPRGTEVKANMEALLRADTQTRYAGYQLALGAGFLSVNEVRELEGLAPAPDGDFKTAEQKQAAFEAAQAAPGPGDTTKEAAPNE